MIINKEIASKILRDYIFITGTFDIDSKYFKKKIDEGVQNSNLNNSIVIKMDIAYSDLSKII